LPSSEYLSNKNAIQQLFPNLFAFAELPGPLAEHYALKYM